MCESDAAELQTCILTSCFCSLTQLPHFYRSWEARWWFVHLCGIISQW